MRKKLTAAGPALWIALAAGLYVVARYAPPLDGLSAQAQAVLGAASAAAVLWITEAVPLGLTALLVLLLLGLCPGVRFVDAASGFAGDVTFFLIGAIGIGAGVEASGLAERMARFLCRSARASPARLYAQLIAGIPVLALLIPSAITRNAILVPAYRDALADMSMGKSMDKAPRAGRAVMLALGILNPLASSALLTGGIVSMTAATLLGGFSWLRWFALMAPPYYALLVGGAVVIRGFVGRLERGEAAVARSAKPQPFAPAERRTLAVLALTATLWLTDSLHHLSAALPALFGAGLLLLPGIGVISWKTFESRLSWGLILTVGTSLSLATLMTKTGAAAWLGGILLGQLAPLAAAPKLLVAALIVAVAVVHLAITNLAACVAILLPINAAIAARAGINPVATGLLLTVTVDAVILYPVQTATNLMAYESGYFDRADVLKLGLGMLVLVVIVAMLALPYWALLGLPLQLP
jgi:solute carrier family 13 (sodium-dependent dicarboxylate transporter), member 2/3/5